MVIYEQSDTFHTDRETAVTVGKFDGLHKGHVFLLRELLKYREEGLQTAVLVFGSGLREKNLLTDGELREAFSAFPLDSLVFLPTDPAFFLLAPEDFVREVLIGKFRMKAMVAGRDFRFGKDRAGDVSLLRKLSGEARFELKIFDKIGDGSDAVSSTEIRNLLTEGDTEKASEMLGYDYFISGEIVHGQHLGTKLGFPTINIIPDPGKFLPAFGVYAASAEIEGQTYGGLLNLGIRPSVSGPHGVLLEVHLLHTEGDFYGKNARIRFKRRIREERHFDSLGALKAQVLSDLSEAEKEFFAKNVIDKG